MSRQTATRHDRFFEMKKGVDVRRATPKPAAMPHRRNKRGVIKHPKLPHGTSGTQARINAHGTE